MTEQESQDDETIHLYRDLDAQAQLQICQEDIVSSVQGGKGDNASI